MPCRHVYVCLLTLLTPSAIAQLNSPIPPAAIAPGQQLAEAPPLQRLPLPPCISDHRTCFAYTGDLMGYYREGHGADSPLSSLHQAFERSLASSPEAQTLLLGMGNNFGPEYEAAYQNSWCGASPCYKYKGVDAHDNNVDNIAASATEDNVADYLIQHRYFALVPGPYDLIYGSRWLREMAIKLAQTPNAPYLLAANLFAVPQKGTPIASTCHALFEDLKPDDLTCGKVNTPYKQLRNTGYRLEPFNHVRLLVIGVVDQHLFDHVASRHKDFCIKDLGHCGTVGVIGPKDAIEGVLDAEKGNFDEVVVMAQMSYADAFALAKTVGCTSSKSDKCLDSKTSIILSEADEMHATVRALQSTPWTPPVIAPFPAVIQSGVESGFYAPLNTLRAFPIESGTTVTSTRINITASATSFGPQPLDPYAELAALAKPLSPCPASGSCREQMIPWILSRLIGPEPAATSDRNRANFSLMEDGDFTRLQFPPNYDPTFVCNSSNLECKLQAWLDTIMWRGDFKRKVLITGKEIRTMMKASAEASDNDRLKTFQLDAQGANGCPRNEDGASKNYCVQGMPINDDSTYWVATTDHLAEGNASYPIAAGSDSAYYRRLEEKQFDFVTEEVANEIIGELKRTGGGSNTNELAKVQKAHDPLNWPGRFEVDLAKLYAGFSSLEPDGGDSYAGAFQGVSEPKASVTSLRQLDFEGNLRAFYRFNTGFGIGGRGSAGYATTHKGTLAGGSNQTSWLLNAADYGPFVQFDLMQAYRYFHRSSSTSSSPAFSPSHWFASFAVTAGWSRTQDIQPSKLYQSVGGKFSPGVKGTSVVVDLDRQFGDAWKIGLRWAPATRKTTWQYLSSDSYMEFGFQNTQTTKLLTGLELHATDGTVTQCTLSTSSPLSNCFATANPATVQFVRSIQTPEAFGASGLYWDVNLGYKPWTRVTLGARSSTGYANFKVNPDHPANQAAFSIPLTLSAEFQILPNLTIGPSWGQYLFRTQDPFFYGTTNPVLVDTVRNTTFLFTTKWYFFRNTAVPFERVPVITGPATLDQTKSVQGNVR